MTKQAQPDLLRQTDTNRGKTDIVVRQRRRTIHLPENNTIMKARTSIFSLLLLGAVTGALAQVASKAADPSLPRPLNLSARKPVAPVTDPALLLLESATPTAVAPRATGGGNEDAGAAALPFGAGFESRQLGSTAGNSGANGSGNAGGGSGGGGGRGGSGRGR